MSEEKTERLEKSIQKRIKSIVEKQVYFTEQQLAHRWNVSVQLLQKMRYAGTGPEVTWIGSAVRYSLHNARCFERANTHKSRSAKDVAA